jgi:hypothetical protein
MNRLLYPLFGGLLVMHDIVRALDLYFDVLLVSVSVDGDVRQAECHFFAWR